MRVRQLSSTGDMTFGLGSGNFLVNSPAAVAQCVRTRLGLWEGEWFLDTTEGMPWMQQVLGTHTVNLYDAAIIARVLGTPGVIGLANYSSTLNTRTRILTVTGTINTQYGQAELNSPVVLPS